MPAVSVGPEDLKPFADIPPDKAQAMCDDAMALAAFYAPCILDPRFEYEAAATAIIRGAILRANEAGTGAVTSQTAGQFSVGFDSSVRQNGIFTKQEIEQLQSMCSDPNAGQNGDREAWGYDTVPSAGPQHAEICCKTFNEPHCSCGANLTKDGRPLWDGYAS